MLYTFGFTLYSFPSLAEPEFKDGLLGVAPYQLDAAVVVAHDLAGDGQADARAFLLGGVEWDKDLLLAAHWDRLAVVGYLNDGYKLEHGLLIMQFFVIFLLFQPMR